MLLLGCKPEGRNTEQHDIFFTIGNSLSAIVPDIKNAWPEAKGKIHIDAWRQVNVVNGYKVKVISRENINSTNESKPKLFFINLGGYKEGEFEEFHYKMILACTHQSEAIKQAKATTFYKHAGFAIAPSHIDDKYGVDVDDICEIEDILPLHIKDKFAILLLPAENEPEDMLNIGYFKLDKL